MTALNLLVDCAATYRLTRLATKDVLTQPARDRIIRWTYRDHPMLLDAVIINDTTPAAWQTWAEDDPNPPKLATLITCRWCAGIWIAIAVTALRLTAPRTWRKTAWMLTCSTAAPLLARLEND